MIKILKPGTKRQITCKNCGAVLSYDAKEDIKNETNRKFSACIDGYEKLEQYITCPQCENRIILNVFWIPGGCHD